MKDTPNAAILPMHVEQDMGHDKQYLQMQNTRRNNPTAVSKLIRCWLRAGRDSSHKFPESTAHMPVITGHLAAALTVWASSR